MQMPSPVTIRGSNIGYLYNLSIFAKNTEGMRVIAKKTIVEYYTMHADAKTALEEWFEKAELADWQNFSDIKDSFRSADWVGNNRVVFNIKGNDYKLVVLVLFKIKMVYVRFIGTHAEYDKIQDISNI